MPSYYGLGTYGTKLYSALNPVSFTGGIAPPITLSATLSIGGKTAIVGNLAPSVVFSGSLSRIRKLAGNLVPAVTFAASGLGTKAVSGDMAPQISLKATLTAKRAIRGLFLPEVIFAATMDSGPLWTPSELCEADWEETELCSG